MPSVTSHTCCSYVGQRVEKRALDAYPVWAMKTATRFLVRRMRLSDIPQVLEVERQSFPSMWPPTAFRRELQQNRLAHYIVIGEAVSLMFFLDVLDSGAELGSTLCPVWQLVQTAVTTRPCRNSPSPWMLCV